MSLLSNIQSRISNAARDAEKAAADAAARAKEAVTSTIDAAKDKARAVVSDPPAPSAASVEHAQAAAADAVRNSTPPPNKKAQPKKEGGVYAGFGVSAAAGADPQGNGGEVSAGYLVGTAGTIKPYGTTGTSSGAVGISAGVGFEAGLVADVDGFYGKGHQYTFPVPLCPEAAVSLSTSEDDKHVAALSVSVGKSVGLGVFRFDTNTEAK